MASPDGPAAALARRLRELRERHWPDAALTQRDLARALGGDRPLSVPLISSWENTNRPTVPPAERLSSYAAFFATHRSVEQRPYRLFTEAELKEAERERRTQLERELMDARALAVVVLAGATGRRSGQEAPREDIGGPWRFPDGRPITMVCPEVPPAQKELLASPDDAGKAYAELYSYADLDALFELHGHIRATNPAIRVSVRKATELQPDDYTNHLVLLGGVDWNNWTKLILDKHPMPVTEHRSDPSNPEVPGEFRVDHSDGKPEIFRPEWSEGRLISDVGHFLRTRNPFNHLRTVTVCNGTDGRGVLAMVRALTDERFWVRNSGYVDDRFADCDAFSIMTRIHIVDGAVLTPDWTMAETRLHEWKG